MQKVRITVLDSTNMGRGVELVGIGTAGNRNNSGYNGLHRITESSKPKQFNCVLVGDTRWSAGIVVQGSNPGTFVSSPKCLESFLLEMVPS